MAGPWTDAHCHLADPRLAGQLDDIVDRSVGAGVVAWVQGGVDPDDWQRQREVRARLGSDRVRLSFGLHPWWVVAATDDEVDAGLAALEVALGDADALGEIGFDTVARRNKQPGATERQQRAFVAQLELAARQPRPLVLHVVRGHDYVLEQLERHAPFARGGLVHAFTAGAAVAHRYVALGFCLSLGGALATRPERARQLAAIDPEHVLVETDAPDQAPRDWGVSHNEPAFLPRIAAALAPVWGLAAADLLDRSHRRLQRLFSP